MALAISTVAHSISGLTVAGLVIKDKHDVPAGGDPRQPLLIPLTQYVSDFTMERDSFGGGSVAKMTVTYTLNYRFLYKPVGTGRENILEVFSAMVDMVALIWDAVLAIDVIAGAIDIIPISPVGMGVVEDPSAMPYWGCDLSFQVMEFVN